MRHVDMKAALYSMGSRVGLGCISQSDTSSQSLFTFLAGCEQQSTACESRQNLARARAPPHDGLIPRWPVGGARR